MRRRNSKLPAGIAYPRAAVAVGLSLMMAFSGVPTQVLAEVARDTAVAYEGVEGEGDQATSKDGRASSPDQTAGQQAADQASDSDPELRLVALPQEADGLIYDGTEQEGVALAEGYELSGDTRATHAGDYIATATPAEGWAWEDGTREPVQLRWSIARKHAVVRAEGQSKVAGEADPVFTATVEGLVGTDQLVYELLRQPGEEPGEYAIVAQGDAEQSDYEVTFEAGTLVVSEPETKGDDQAKAPAKPDTVPSSDETPSSAMPDAAPKKDVPEAPDAAVKKSAPDTPDALDPAPKADAPPTPAAPATNDPASLDSSSPDSSSQDVPRALTTQASDASTSGTWGTCPWDISEDGTLTIHAGKGADTNGKGVWPTQYNVIKKIVCEEGVVLPADCSSLFNSSVSYTNSNIELEIDLSKADASHVKYANSMFTNSDTATTIDLTGWQTPELTNMASMFSCSSKLKTIKGLTDLDTSHVTTADSMFYACRSLESLDLSGWDTSSMTCLRNMFHDCESLTSLNLSGWNTQNVTDASNMLYGCLALQSFTVGNGYVIQAPDMVCASAASNGKWYSNTDNTWYTRNQIVASRSGIADTYTSEGEAEDPNPQVIESGTWGTCAWTIAADGTLTVEAGEGVSQLNRSPWGEYQSFVKGAVFKEGVKLPADCSHLFWCFGELTSVDASKCDASGVSMLGQGGMTGGMFCDCSKLASVDVTGWDTSGFTRIASAFEGCSSLTQIKGVESWDTSNVIDMSGTFKDCKSLTSLDLHAWQTSKVTDMSDLFWQCTSLESLNISGWDTSSMREATFMFSDCKSLADLGVSSLNVSKLDRAEGMFSNCTAVTSLDLSAWNTESLRDVDWMFADCTALESLDLSGWDTSKVEESYAMFDSCSPTTFKVGEGYEIMSYAMVPAPVYGYQWRSSATGEPYTKDQIVTNRSKVADTYTQELIPASAMTAQTVATSVSNTYDASTDTVRADSNIMVSSASGRITYANVSTNATSKGFKVAWDTGAVTIPKATPVGTYPLHVRVTDAGDANHTTKSVVVSYDIKVTAASIAGASVSNIPNQAWTGKELKPKPTVKLQGIILKEGTDYTLSYKNNVKAGTATVTVTGRGNYTGTQDATFKIVAKTFPDVAPGAWYANVVARAAGLGLIGGYADGHFGPNDRITRGQVAVVLWNMAGGPAAGAGARPFSDVASGAYYYEAVRWASSRGVVTGYANGRFGPNDNVTREQFAVMLANYAKQVAGKPASGSAADFASMSDHSKVSSWAAPSVGWCFRSQILSGSGGKVLPQGNATRAEAAKMVVYLNDLLA